MIGSREDLEGLRILVPSSNIARDVLRGSLGRFGALVDVIEVYRTEPIKLSLEELRKQFLSESVDDVVFASPSALASFVEVIRDAGLERAFEGIRVTCIGPVTADAAVRLGVRVHCVAREPTVDSIVEAMEKGSLEARE